jgi:uncharacterized LabA/DUF88 family protein
MQRGNFAFIDAQNLYMGTQSLGWSIDVFRFRVYLKDKYDVTEAYWFVGYLAENQSFYELLQKAGFIVIFKEIARTRDGKPKGSVDVDLTLHTLIKRDDYDRAVLVTSDGDFGVLVKYLKDKGQLRAVLSPNRHHTSFLLRKATGSDLAVQYLDVLQKRIGRQK